MLFHDTNQFSAIMACAALCAWPQETAKNHSSKRGRAGEVAGKCLMCLIFIFKKRNKKPGLKTGQRDLAVWMAFKFYNFFAKRITESREKRGIFDAGKG
ncbi:hypothetical protein [Thalassospira marina]|uniref:Secreted protein n=1 Tax=Thalassospira marina TaxID=2048283 RepID=A0ABM6Q559_9PROT|nr:hypothetical protein [Thalassospira marina]AUG51638.1 hypothetical protein CSC3H3_02110 [Thalassospira marina]